MLTLLQPLKETIAASVRIALSTIRGLSMPVTYLMVFFDATSGIVIFLAQVLDLLVGHPRE
jgi:hypothetical protein